MNKPEINPQSVREQAEALVAQMTVEEKASQLRYDAPAIDRLGIPAYNWWNEALHGVARAGAATVFPQAIGLAAMFDGDMMEAIGDVIAEEGRAKYNMYTASGDRDIYKGLTFWSPNVNIFRDPRWGRGHETYGEDPYLTGELGKRFVGGLQQKNEQGYLKSAACAKHFAVHSGPESLRHEFDAVVSQKDLWETYLPAFEALVTEAEVEGVMGAYNRTNGEPCCGSKTLLDDILRDRWGFQGYVTSDCWAIKDFHLHHRVTDTMQQSVALAIKHGCDINCGDSYLYLLSAYQEGLVTEEDISRACVHAFTTRIRLGQFDPECAYNSIPYTRNTAPEHANVAIKAAENSIVLLKNNHILPLDTNQYRSVAVVGPNADNRVALLGNYHGTADRYVTPLEGLQDALEPQGIRVMYSAGCEMKTDRSESLALAHDRITEAVATANACDVVVACLGLDETVEGEAADLEGDIACGDKVDLNLPAQQVLLLDKLLRTGKPVILVLMTGSAMAIQSAEEGCAAILQAWYPGARGGRALANIMTGKVSPSGKLPVTFYRSTDDLPAFTEYAMQNRTYRYYTGEPLYPFGYGLSYADFTLDSVAFAAPPVRGDEVMLSAVVTNRSDFTAEDVVQVYVKNTTNPLAVTNHSLCAFQRVSLDAGQSKTLRIGIRPEALRVVDMDGSRKLCSDSYRLYVGFSQPDSRSTALTGRKPVELALF